MWPVIFSKVFTGSVQRGMWLWSFCCRKVCTDVCLKYIQGAGDSHRWLFINNFHFIWLCRKHIYSVRRAERRRMTKEQQNSLLTYKFHSPPMYCSGGWNLSSRHLKTSADKKWNYSQAMCLFCVMFVCLFVFWGGGCFTSPLIQHLCCFKGVLKFSN